MHTVLEDCRSVECLVAPTVVWMAFNMSLVFLGGYIVTFHAVSAIGSWYSFLSLSLSLVHIEQRRMKKQKKNNRMRPPQFSTYSFMIQPPVMKLLEKMSPNLCWCCSDAFSSCLSNRWVPLCPFVFSRWLPAVAFRTSSAIWTASECQGWWICVRYSPKLVALSCPYLEDSPAER